MAEFLVYDKENWLDKLTAAEVNTSALQYGESFLKKHEHRLARGDSIKER